MSATDWTVWQNGFAWGSALTTLLAIGAACVVYYMLGQHGEKKPLDANGGGTK